MSITSKAIDHAIYNDVNPEVAETKVKVDALPTDPADQSAVEAAITAAHSTTNGKVDVVQATVDAGFLAGAKSSEIAALDTVVDGVEAKVDIVDTVVDAIKVVTDALPTFPPDPADQSAVEAAISASEAAVRGVDNDTLKTLSDQIDTIAGGSTSAESKGTFTYLNAGAEQTVVELVSTDRRIIHGIWLDLVNITQDGTIQMYYKIDGINYRLVTSDAFVVASDSDGIYVDLSMGITDSLKLTYTEGADEGADRDIAYSVIYQTI